MIKTLRITIILTAVVAGLFFVLSGIFGLRHDEGKEAFLANPTVAEKLKKGDADRNVSEQELPLVKQAQAFALRINPPKPQSESPVQAVKVVETPKFRLIGTSYYPDDPNRSIALIDEPGKGMHWVVKSEKIGYLVITEIGDQKIRYNDGQKNMEMTAEKPDKPSQIMIISNDGSGRMQLVSPSGISAAQAGAPDDVQPTAEQLKDNVEFIKKLMADPNSAGVSPEEANELKGLGEFLAQLEKEQAKIDSNQPPQEEPNEAAESNLPHSE